MRRKLAKRVFRYLADSVSDCDAWALLINPELLILDDALSAVDAETEAEILANLKQRAANKTTIISAHRLSSVWIPMKF